MQSVQRVVSDGTLQIVDLSITYFDRSEINVYINSELYTDWHWASDVEDRIIFNSPIPAGVEVLIKRTTDLSKLRHYFSKGSAFTAEALDEDLQQVLHIAQEATEANLAGDFYNDIDMHGYRVKNIGQAVDDSDALTLRQYKQDAQGAWQARERAVQAEQNAVASATSAAQSAAASQRDSETAVNAAIAAEQYAQLAGMRLEDFERKYLGALDADPTTGPQGIPLEDGMLYFRTTPPRVLRVYSSVEGWKNAPEGPQGPQGPQGPKGDKGDKGDHGPANSLSVGTVSVRTDGQAAVRITGQSPAQVIHFEIPQGPKGDKGDPGPAGPPGAGSGDVLGPSSATEGQAAVFDDATGKRLRAFSGSGMLKSVNGVLQAATAGTDYVTPSGTVQNAQHAVSADSASYATSAGVAASADKLSTPRSINGVPFDGTANITVEDSTKQPLNSNLTSISNLSAAGVANRKSDGTWEVLSKVPSAANADYATSAGSANTASSATTAASATKLATARTINGVPFDGTGNITVYDNTKQPLNSNLTNISNLSGSGYAYRNATGDWSLGTPTVSVSWHGVTEKPSSYPPSWHTHDLNSIYQNRYCGVLKTADQRIDNGIKLVTWGSFNNLGITMNANGKTNSVAAGIYQLTVNLIVQLSSTGSSTFTVYLYFGDTQIIPILVDTIFDTYEEAFRPCTIVVDVPANTELNIRAKSAGPTLWIKSGSHMNIVCLGLR